MSYIQNCRIAKLEALFEPWKVFQGKKKIRETVFFGAG